MKVLSEIGRHFIIGLSGPSLSDSDIRILTELKPLGVLLLKRNFLEGAPYEEWIAALDALLKDVKRKIGRDDIIVSIDHEGGRVHRTPSPITHFPTACRYASQAEAVGRAMGEELRSIGINVLWGPVADVHSNPTNPVIGERALGTNAKDVSSFASAFVKGVTSTGVIPCAKHFPGHGDTSTDSHFTLPSHDATINDLRERELVPFRTLIEGGIPCIMTAHILFPRIDPDRPATLSKKILKGILRDELGFSGTVVTDDLDMKAISMRFALHEVVSHAFTAGVDIFLSARFPDGASLRPLELAQALLEARSQDLITPQELGASNVRVESLMKQVFSSTVTKLDDSVFEHHARIADACENS